jgi:hypothetical protein
MTIDGVGLLKRFIQYFNTQLVTIFCSYYHTQTSVLSLLQSPLAVALQWLSMTDIPLPLGSRTISTLSYQLLTARALND